ncbi:Rho GTPase-activating protein 1 [Heracleum sosnowskyi]|uniref:Rho GTPase-activating protein 1 n=1 Tax=Heracleum sosnowskyi TaxID=360622 RepID=A0AAD8IEG9_9APIA|nr:Rho GTPase-activating protein 1 [Heracleum sosnowskyi]
MTEVIQSSPTSSSSSSLHNFESHSFQEQETNEGSSSSLSPRVLNERDFKERDKNSRDQLSLLAVLVTLFRKSFWVTCTSVDRAKLSGMDIGWPTNVQHVAHVTFDRFNGFLGLPVEFEPEVPRRAPSASTTVFGVSTESMQLSYDHRGNSVPTILLLMQQRLYAQEGLQAEGIFRINADNGQEEFVRSQLNAGVVPIGIDVHCLAGLIKAWFRELPAGVLDSLSPEQVMQCQTEEDCSALVMLLPASEAALLNWAVNLMADVVQHEHLNKMNARNVAMVFAPNMTQMADPLTALMYAVQVMNFLKALITKTLKERKSSVVEASPFSHVDPSDENGHPSAFQLCLEETAEEDDVKEQSFITEDPHPGTECDINYLSNISDEEHLSYTTTEETDGGGYADTPSHFSSVDNYVSNISDEEHLSYTITDESDGKGCVDTPSRISSVDNTSESSLSSAAKMLVEDTAQFKP